MNDPLRIDLDLATPAYRQIADGIRRRLVEGGLAVGSMLPPVRRLALDLGIHHNTVAQAYRQLAEEGWLELTRGRGARVVDRTPPTAAEPRALQFETELGALVTRALADGLPAERIASELRSRVEQLKKESG